MSTLGEGSSSSINGGRSSTNNSGKNSIFDRTSSSSSNANYIKDNPEDSQGWLEQFDSFWFKPVAPNTIGLMRLLTGCLIFYITLCYSFELLAFVGPDGIVNQALADHFRKDTPMYVMAPEWSENTIEITKTNLSWSIFYHVTSPFWIWAFHLGFLTANFCMAVGLFSRTTAIISWIGALAYVHRAPSGLFGMDAMIVILLFYLMLAPGGEIYSLDHYFQKLRRKKAGDPNWNESPQPLVLSNFVTRMIQIHFCIIYFAAATSKLQGSSWWNGTALWGVLANYSFNPMHISAYTSLLVFLTKHKVLWEIIMTIGCVYTIVLESSFPFLVWNRKLKWFMICGSIMLHTGIGLLMGLTTFSLCMITLVLAFVPPEFIKALIDRYVIGQFKRSTI